MILLNVRKLDLLSCLLINPNNLLLRQEKIDKKIDKPLVCLFF
jgi:hypothetical protein